ncbi:hypothetical protein EV361DRAFT_869213 [Lentinula raphanica]|nr:hypothetical protein EV361DRAFT_869213 [Lentinula raphanica]
MGLYLVKQQSLTVSPRPPYLQRNIPYKLIIPIPLLQDLKASSPLAGSHPAPSVSPLSESSPTAPPVHQAQDQSTTAIQRNQNTIILHHTTVNSTSNFKVRVDGREEEDAQNPDVVNLRTGSGWKTETAANCLCYSDEAKENTVDDCDTAHSFNVGLEILTRLSLVRFRRDIVGGGGSLLKVEGAPLEYAISPVPINAIRFPSASVRLVSLESTLILVPISELGWSPDGLREATGCMAENRDGGRRNKRREVGDNTGGFSSSPPIVIQRHPWSNATRRAES